MIKLEIMNVIYEEKQPMIRVFSVINVAVIILLAFMTWKIWQRSPDSGLAAVVVNTAIGLFLVVVMFNFYYLKISVSEDKLFFGFGWFKKSVYIKNISGLKIEKFEFKKFLGYGIRVAFDKTVGFVAKGGNGIKFIDAHTKKTYYITSDRAEELQTILKNQGAQT